MLPLLFHIRMNLVLEGQHNLACNFLVLRHLHRLVEILELVVVGNESLEIIGVLDLGQETDGAREPVGGAAGTSDVQGLPDGLADLNRNLTADGVTNNANASGVTSNIKQGCDADVVARALDYNGRTVALVRRFSSASRAPGSLNWVGSTVTFAPYFIAFSRRDSTGSITITFAPEVAHTIAAEQPIPAAADDCAVVGSIRIAAVAPYAPVTNVEVLNEDTQLVDQSSGMNRYTLLPESCTRQSRQESPDGNQPHGSSGMQRTSAVLAVCTLMAGQYAVAYNLVANLYGGACAADFYCSTNPLVTGGVRSDIVTAFCGQTLEALYVRLDRPQASVNQYLVRLQRRRSSSSMRRSNRPCINAALHLVGRFIIVTPSDLNKGFGKCGEWRVKRYCLSTLHFLSDSNLVCQRVDVAAAPAGPLTTASMSARSRWVIISIGGRVPAGYFSGCR